MHRHSCNIATKIARLLEFLLIIIGHSCIAPPPSSPIVAAALDGYQVTLTWTQAPTDVVDNYTIMVETTALSCVAYVPTMENVVPGSSRSFLVDGMEEYCNISISLIARNMGGKGSAAIMMQTPPAGSLNTI